MTVFHDFPDRSKMAGKAQLLHPDSRDNEDVIWWLSVSRCVYFVSLLSKAADADGVVDLSGKSPHSTKRPKPGAMNAADCCLPS